ncbi:O-methyltransferase family 2 [Fibrella aestuarina BUZ 2]|uniref:O-methyltransferase family 2 n=1 Tax=Fibrella aestuarina BUZ 2 TaxID=1166018 RepID=I0KD72_9BACT|nr:methyltransferase [Fibrella aestuarina]CCH02075.1 O-methyltransferase family 2 [Fibrella aestuarina BUZ 2]
MRYPTQPDPAPITRHLRAMFGSRLLLAAVHHLPVFDVLSGGPLSLSELSTRLGLAERPAMVLFPALCAMDLLRYDQQSRLAITELGRYVTQSQTPNLRGYTGLEKDDPGVVEMAQLLRHDGPLDAPQGISFVKEGDGPSPMDDTELARKFTLGLAGRAQLLSPIVAANLPKHDGHLLDVAGGTGFYTYEWLLANPNATATLFDRPAVLAVAAELLEQFTSSGRPGADAVKERVTFQPGDMLTDDLPQTDLLLAASLFHDWPTPTCEQLAQRFAAALRPGGEIWVHDSFLDDTLDGPLAATDYSAQLFWATKGRCYSRAEYQSWFKQAGLTPLPAAIPTQLDYGLIGARKG